MTLDGVGPQQPLAPITPLPVGFQPGVVYTEEEAMTLCGNGGRRIVEQTGGSAFNPFGKPGEHVTRYEPDPDRAAQRAKLAYHIGNRQLVYVQGPGVLYRVAGPEDSVTVTKPRGTQVMVGVVDEFGDVHEFRRGSEAEAEIARVREVKLHRAIERGEAAKALLGS